MRTSMPGASGRYLISFRHFINVIACFLVLQAHCLLCCNGIFCLAFFVWQEMERRKQQQSDNAASSARNYFSAQTQAESARQQAAFDAAQRSRQILEEEKAKDRAWREAVLKVSSCLCKCHLVLMSLSVLSASCMCVSVRHKQRHKQQLHTICWLYAVLLMLYRMSLRCMRHCICCYSSQSSDYRGTWAVGVLSMKPGGIPLLQQTSHNQFIWQMYLGLWMTPMRIQLS